MDDQARQRVPVLVRMFRLQWEPAQNCHVLLYPEGMVRLSPSAAAILQHIDGQRDVAAIIEELERAFPGTDLAEDVLNFIEQARVNGWITH